ncbi:hypothetical protein GCM10023081_32000 [Arthrobacter ginkgonis]|uniref:Integral membrane protein n=1 Tax=Arthrobacter ginkgonis TaxID=1630594 RepID=A0ABP7CK78_9MICC
MSRAVVTSGGKAPPALPSAPDGLFEPDDLAEPDDLVGPDGLAGPGAPAPAGRATGPASRWSPGRGTTVSLGALCLLAWAASIAVGMWVDCGPVLHRVGLAGHILALAVAFGAILVVDWVGFLWLLGKREIRDTGRLEAAAQPLIWGGLAALLATGAMIKPDLSNPLTQVKMACVLVLMLNGVALAPAMRRLHGLPADTRFTAMAARLRARLLVALTISQACWWTCILVGLLNSTLRRWGGSGGS